MIPDARHGRGKRFVQQLLSPFTLIVGIGVTGMMIWMAIDEGAVDGAATIIAIALAILGRRAWRRARKQTRDAFFFGYAKARGLGDPGPGELPPATSLLRAGDHRQSGRVMQGELNGMRNGLLGHYVFETVAGSDDSERVIFHDFTVVLFKYEGVSARLGDMNFLARQEGRQDDATYPTETATPLVLESLALDRRYRMTTTPEVDQVLLRRVFSPTFIVWLGEKTPSGFGFDLEGEWLCCYSTGLRESATDLDDLVEFSTGFAKRLEENLAGITTR